MGAKAKAGRAIVWYCAGVDATVEGCSLWVVLDQALIPTPPRDLGPLVWVLVRVQG